MYKLKKISCLWTLTQGCTWFTNNLFRSLTLEPKGKQNKVKHSYIKFATKIYKWYNFFLKNKKKSKKKYLLVMSIRINFFSFFLEFKHAYIFIYIYIFLNLRGMMTFNGFFKRAYQHFIAGLLFLCFSILLRITRIRSRHFDNRIVFRAIRVLFTVALGSVLFHY